MLQLALLILVTSSVAEAADLGIAQIGGLQHDLARPFLWKKSAGDLSLGLQFEKSEGYDFDTKNFDNEANELAASFALRLPWNLEGGLSLHSREERITQKQLKLPLSSAAWLRLHLWEGPAHRTSIGGQFEPGTKKDGSFHQVGDPRRSLFASQEYSVFSGLHTALYFAKSWRGPEYFGDWRLGDELSFGGKLTVGASWLHAYGEASARQLVVKYKDQDQCQQEGNLWKVGIASQIGDFDISASIIVASQEALFGIPREGFEAALHYNLYAARERADLPATASQQSKSSTAKSPTQKTTIKGQGFAPVIESSDPDDFELLEKSRELENRDKDKPVPSEIAERELKALREASQKAEALEKSKQKERQQEGDKAVREEIQQDNKIIREHRSDIEEELNEYSLPDSEELNWNGLRK